MSGWWYVLASLILLKVYNKLTMGVFRSGKRLDGVVAIVTGGNSGIGRETARELARRGARVILACRDLQKAELVREDIIRSTGNTNVVVRPLDLSNLSSVRRFAHDILVNEPEVHILINNAGMPGKYGKRFKDGLELTMLVNHLGPFLLTNLLLDLLKKSAPSRIIFVSSIMHGWFERVNPDALSRNSSNPFLAYGNTKMCNILTAAYLADLLRGTGVTSNSLHPGGVSTEIWNKISQYNTVNSMIKHFIGIFMKNTVQGAQTTIYLAVADEVRDVTGKYFVDCKETQPSRRARDKELARRVWNRSCELVGIGADHKSTIVSE